MNILQGLTHTKKIAGTHQAIVCGDHRYTWNEFDQRTDALARGLASLGIQRGDRIAIMMLNCHRYLELYYACARMGAVIVPLNIRLARPEIVFILNDSETKALVGSPLRKEPDSRRADKCGTVFDSDASRTDHLSVCPTKLD